MADLVATIIVPVKTADIEPLRGFGVCYARLLTEAGPGAPYEVIVVDDSAPAVYDWLARELAGTGVIHVPRGPAYDAGLNNKLNSVFTALDIARGRYVILLDDDCRPVITNMHRIVAELQGGRACVRSMVRYDDRSVGSLVDVAGIFFVNATTRQKQFWGNISFARAALDDPSVLSRDVLFDELAIERHFRRRRLPVGYLGNEFIPMIGHFRCRRFLEQRVRYAYENLAYPVRFAFHLALIPALAGVGVMADLAVSLYLLGAVTAGVLAAALYGQLRYSGGRHPRWTFVLATVWFWFYPITAWMALYHRSRGGMRFGGKRIKRAA